MYDVSGQRTVKVNGPLDARLGVVKKGIPCETCGEQYDACNGHFGYVKLALPLFHIGYFKLTITILQEICKDCSSILLPEESKRSYLKDLRKPDIDNLRRTQICKKIQEQCKKAGTCYHCGATNGTVKKSGAHPLKIIHEKYRRFTASNAKSKQPPHSLQVFEEKFKLARERNNEIEKHFKKAVDDMNPLRVLNLFRRIIDSDCELLGMDPRDGRPEMFLWQYIPVPPVCIRPSVAQESASTEDDLTQKLSDMVQISNLIREGLRRGAATSQIMEQWDFLQLQAAMYINSDVPSLQSQSAGKAIRGFCQRLKGKQGRFRGNLSGKRVDFSARTVISPDPNLAINEVAVPILVAKNMTYPEKVNKYNIEKLRGRVINGETKYPGAVNIIKPWGKIWLKYGDREFLAKNLKIGETVERHLEDGDIVLFNRQPSLHKLSILSHYVKVRPHRTFRLNECVCTPYNADFDGDEMNLHVPQTEEARAEAVELMGVKYNLATPKNGEPIIAAIQDFITASYLLTNKDNFFDRKTFTNLCMFMEDGKMLLDLPPPTVWKPQMLWTGKQVFNILMRPNKKDKVLVNLEGPCREFRPVKGRPNDLDENDCWMVIRNSEIMCGVMDKAIVGSGKKDSIFYVIFRDFGPDAAVAAMGRLAKLSARWLTDRGFSIGISDVYPGGELQHRKDELIETAYTAVNEVIAKSKAGLLPKSAGCDDRTTLETKISGLLSEVRQAAGRACVAELSRWNAPLIMAASGSKGSHINVSQMIAAVGQQIIGGKRVENGFQDRTLPHFPKYAIDPPSKGFVRNSFFTGLTPSEFIFHAMSGREGLVDTAVKTAETGYMSRRLIKSLEDLSSHYDDTVRNSTSAIIQFSYGEDLLDPGDMEGKAKPVNFDRTYMHCQATTWNNHDDALSPIYIAKICKEKLDVQRLKYGRKSEIGEPLQYKLQDDVEADQFESRRGFLDSVEEFILKKVHASVVWREKHGLPGETSADSSEPPSKRSRKNKTKTSSRTLDITEQAWSRIHKISRKTLNEFLDTCNRKYQRAKVEPGHAVGAVGAQSIGEPGTQMTLKTFHFAGVAGMSITEGVPRIKEIINASKDISTPLITCELETQGVIGARFVKGRIEKTYLRDIMARTEQVVLADESFVVFIIDQSTIQKLQLEVHPKSLKRSIIAHRKLKLDDRDVTLSRLNKSSNTYVIKVKAQAREDNGKSKRGRKEGTLDILQRMEQLSRVIPDIVIIGHPDAQRAVIATDDKDEKKHRVLVEGYGFRACLNTQGVHALTTRTNSVIETRNVLGIEAARKTIIDEISQVMRTMDIDPRHMQLLADVMTFKGEVLGITRFGLAKMRDSVLQLASFEKTPDHLFDAAWHMKCDQIKGVSECIIMGQEMNLGTGASQVLRDLRFRPGDIQPKDTVFETTFEEIKLKKLRG